MTWAFDAPFFLSTIAVCTAAAAMECKWEGRKEAERANEREMSEHDVLYMPKLPCLEQGRRSADTLFFLPIAKMKKEEEVGLRANCGQLISNKPTLLSQRIVDCRK